MPLYKGGGIFPVVCLSLLKLLNHILSPQNWVFKKKLHIYK